MSWKSVVEPVFDIEKSVVVANDEVEEPIAKAVVLKTGSLEFNCIEIRAYGDVVPKPDLPGVRYWLKLLPITNPSH